MLTLIIKTDDGARRKAVVKAGQEITIIRANPFLEKQGDYSLDIELPLAGCAENIRIFGPAHRTEIAKLPYVGKRYHARLYAPPVSLEGTLLVTQFTEKTIKAQFVSGYSDLYNSFKDKDGNDLYIDELPDLGGAWEEDFPLFYHTEMSDSLRTPGYFVEFVNDYYEDPKTHLRPDPDYSIRLALFTGTRDKTTFVAFPVHGNIGGTAVSGNSLSLWEEGISKEYFDFADNVTFSERLPKFIADRSCSVCPQPYLSYVIKRVLKSIGFTLVENEIEGTWLDNIFIANPRKTLWLKNMLPHLTVEDFFSEVTKFLNVFIKVSGKNISIVKNRLGDKVERISNTVLEFTDDIDEDSKNEHVLTGNVAYDFKTENEKKACLPEKVYEYCIARKVVRIDPEEDIVEFEYIKRGEEELRADEQNAITIFPDGNFRCGVIPSSSDHKKYFIDQLGSLIRDWNNPKANVTLKIIPTRVYRDIYTYQYHNPGTLGGVTTVEKKEGYPSILVPDFPGENADLNISDVIFSGASVSSKEYNDRIYIAVNLGLNYHYHYARKERYHPAAVGFNYAYTFFKKIIYGPGKEEEYTETFDFLQTWEYPLDEDPENGKRFTHCPFRLRETQSPCIVTDAWKNTEIDTRVVHTIQFTDQAISFDPTATYIIHGRRFACQKIELKITDRGIEPLKTGYFYELAE